MLSKLTNKVKDLLWGVEEDVQASPLTERKYESKVEIIPGTFQANSGPKTRRTQCDEIELRP